MTKDNEAEEVVLSQENDHEQSGSSEETETELPDAEDYQGKLNATNRFLKKEGYEWKDGKWLKPPASPQQERSAPEQEQKQDYGYAEKAYLNSISITGTEAHNLIFEIARKSGDSIEEVAQSEYVQGKLKALKTQDATPSGSKRTHSAARDTVDYWIEKGELPGDIDLRRKVVNEKLKRAKSATRFGNTDVEIR